MDISASKLNLYLQCPAQYYFRYIAKGAEKGKQEQSSNMDAGSVVHRVLELAARRRIGQQNKTRPTKKELLELLEAVLKEPQRETWKDNTLLTTEVAQLASSAIDACWKTISFAHTIEAEKSYKTSLGPIGGPPGKELKEDLVVNCVLDRVDEQPDKTIRIVDYKAGFGVMSKTEAELDPQVNIYLAAASRLFPGRKIEIEFHYLSRSIILGPIEWTKERDEWVIAYVKAAAYRMLKWDDNRKETPNTYCSSCFRSSECNGYKRLIKGSLLPLSRSIGENLAEYSRLTDVEKNAEAAKKTLKKVINDVCDKAEDGEIYENGYRGRIIFTNKADFSDLKKTVTAAVKILHEADRINTPKKEPAPTPTDQAALAIAHEAAVKRIAMLEEEIKKSQLAFQVASLIAKAQSGLVDKWVETLPKTVGAAVAQAVDGTSTNNGYYRVEVEAITDPFMGTEQEPEPKPAAAAETAA